MPVTIHTLSPTEFLDHCPQLVDVYITAMDYHPKVRAVRNTAWRNAVMFPEFRAVYALDGSRIVGVAYGHLGQGTTVVAQPDSTGSPQQRSPLSGAQRLF